MYKQIIIARKDLNMSPGKLAAQVSHGSMAFLANMVTKNTHCICTNKFYVYNQKGEKIWYRHPDLYDLMEKARAKNEKFFYAEPADRMRPNGKLVEAEPRYIYNTSFRMDGDIYNEWLKGAFTKCVLQARNKNHLLKAKTMAEELGMKEGVDFFLIRDNCNTELEPEDDDGRTLTCIGFKPMDSEIIDKIGKKYHLYI